MQETIAFLRDLCGSEHDAQITDCKVLMSLAEAMSSQKDIYFVGPLPDGKGSGKGGRAEDTDFPCKNYMCVDLDIRAKIAKNEDKIIPDEKLYGYIDDIMSIVDEDEWLRDYRYMTFSGNGIHLYYVGDCQEFTPFEYSMGVQMFYKYVEEKLKDTPHGLDKSCKNISRIMRLPGTYNMGRKRKYGFEPEQCIIVKHNKDVHSAYYKILHKASKKMQAQHEKSIEEANERLQASIGSGEGGVFAAIQSIDVSLLFAKHVGVGLAKDGKNFISPKDGGYIGAWYNSEKNILINSGTHYLKADMNGYSAFSYVKYEVLDTHENSEVFEWFKDRYPEIAEIAEKEYEEKLSAKEKAEELKEDDTGGFINKVLDKTVERTPITWGVHDMDREFGYPEVHDLVLLVAKSGVGKTAFSYFMARKNSDQGTGTLFMNLELKPDVLKLRVARERAGVSKYQLQTHDYTEEQEQIIRDVYQSLSDTETFKMIGYGGPPTLSQVLRDIEKYHTEYGTTLFFVDNLGKISAPGTKNENDRYEKITGELQSLKNRLPITIVLIHHMNKGVSAENKPLGLSKIRSTQKIIDNATIIMETWRDRDTDFPNDAVIFCQYKDTSGGVEGGIEVKYDKGRYLSRGPSEQYCYDSYKPKRLKNQVSLPY